MNSILSVLFIILSGHLYAASQCNSGQDSTKDSQTLIDQLTAAKSSPITKLIYSTYNLGPTTQTQAGTGFIPCAECVNSLIAANVQIRGGARLPTTSSILGPKEPNTMFNLACIKIANKSILPGSGEAICPSGKRVPPIRRKNSRGTFYNSPGLNACNTDELLNYQNAVVSNFLRCGSKYMDGLSKEMYFKMLSRETGFRPQ